MFRFAFRWFFRLSLSAVLLATALWLSKDFLLRQWIVHRLSKVTGLETYLGDLRTDWWAGTLTLTDFGIMNSAEFGGGPLIVVPDLHVELDAMALARRELHLKQARLSVAELNVVRSQNGSTNVIELLQNVQRRATVLDSAAVASKGLRFAGIDTLHLTLGTLRFLNVAQPASNRQIRIGLTDEIVRNVQSAEDFSPLVLRFMLRELTDGGLQKLKGGKPEDAARKGARERDRRSR